MFVVLLNYIKPLAEIDRLVPAHIEFLEAQYAAGLFVASGRKNPRTGGVILAAGVDRAALELALEQDPFKQNLVADYEIIEFSPTKMREGFAVFI